MKPLTRIGRACGTPSSGGTLAGERATGTSSDRPNSRRATLLVFSVGVSKWGISVEASYANRTCLRRVLFGRDFGRRTCHRPFSDRPNSRRATLFFPIEPNRRRTSSMVDVVQLVEHRIVVPSVAGSSPVIHPICPHGERAGASAPAPSSATCYVGV